MLGIDTIFRADETGRKFMTAMIERARAGVIVTLVADAIGSLPGSHTDQRWVRLVSRTKYNELLREGIRIYEYRAGMTHSQGAERR